ncbi:VOC family protein [Colwellia sp. UCD-KL20]|uniref:VOC family protein n=1 Tax=Colwellia sp. UCD-KL20 TaxID=1917165 RepID=UPI0025707880|nr:VOC family protein [Colwellia sp. UCD-KL20]
MRLMSKPKLVFKTTINLLCCCLALLPFMFSSSTMAAETTKIKDTPLKIGGFSETVMIVSNIDTASQFYQDIAGWQVIDDSPADSHLLNLWKLPAHTKVKQTLLANKGTTTGFIRLVELQGIKQQRIRANTQAWDIGGIFDINMRVKSMDETFKKMQQHGWSSNTEPVQFTFGPFVVKEWIVKNSDGVAFALIERVAPTLEGWPNLKKFSRVFNSTQVVADINKSLHFYQNVLGFKTYLEHKGASKEAGPNVLGLPHNIATQVERSVYILHPEGKNEGSIELLQFHGATGKNVSSHAQPPNIGITTLRFPVNNLNALKKLLTDNNIKIESQQKMHLLPYGLVHILSVKTPDNTWLEFYQEI